MADFSQIPWIRAHIELYRTDPERAHDWDSSTLGGPGVLPTLLLTTRGRKSGEPRSVPLIYAPSGESFVIVASKGGLPDHPLWFRNLETDPICELQVGTRSLRARARVAQGDERAALWERMVGVYAPYDDYQKRTDREIPVVVLDPVA